MLTLFRWALGRGSPVSSQGLRNEHVWRKQLSNRACSPNFRRRAPSNQFFFSHSLPLYAANSGLHSLSTGLPLRNNLLGEMLAPPEMPASEIAKADGTVYSHPAALLGPKLFFLQHVKERTESAEVMPFVFDNLAARASAAERTGGYCGVHLGKTGSHHHPKEHNA